MVETKPEKKPLNKENNLGKHSEIRKEVDNLINMSADKEDENIGMGSEVDAKKKKLRIRFFKDKKEPTSLNNDKLEQKTELKDDKTSLNNEIEQKTEKEDDRTSLNNDKLEQKTEIKDNKTSIEDRKSFQQTEIEIVKTADMENLKPQQETKAPVILEPEIRTEDLAYMRKGFGWKGIGARKIIFNNDIKEYVYEVIEPELTAEEEEVKNKLIYFFRVRADLDVFKMNEEEKAYNLERALDKLVIENNLNLNGESREKVYYYVFQEFMGYGKIDILMHDEGIEDISCDGIEIPIFIFHKDFESIRTNILFKDTDELDSFVVKLSQMCGKQISVYEPIVDGKLSDGSRLQTTLSRTITRYSTFTIRRFKEDPMTPIDLVENNTMSLDMAAYFWMAIEKGTSILFCGGTAAGKTTALNALSLFLPSTFKIVSIEDTREINLPHENWIAGTTRTGFTASEVTKTGKDIDMFDLIKVALRQRPKVIIVGEVRGQEAYTLFQAMTTGHLSYSTVHANDMHTLIQRLENKPIDLPRALLTSLDMIVFLNSVTIDGAPVRRITNVTEIIKLDPGSNRLVTITPFNWISEVEDRFENNGGSRILYQIQMQFGWTDARLKQELENRKNILVWMMEKNYRSYKDVGRIVADYSKNPQAVLKKVKEDLK